MEDRGECVFLFLFLIIDVVGIRYTVNILKLIILFIKLPVLAILAISLIASITSPSHRVCHVERGVRTRTVFRWISWPWTRQCLVLSCRFSLPTSALPPKSCDVREQQQRGDHSSTIVVFAPT